MTLYYYQTTFFLTLLVSKTLSTLSFGFRQPNLCSLKVMALVTSPSRRALVVEHWVPESKFDDINC